MALEIVQEKVRIEVKPFLQTSLLLLIHYTVTPYQSRLSDFLFISWLLVQPHTLLAANVAAAAVVVVLLLLLLLCVCVHVYACIYVGEWLCKQEVTESHIWSG
jgi:hypothetical protein